MAELPRGILEALSRRLLALLAALSAAPAWYANQLVAERPLPGSRGPRWGLLAALVLLCLVPRVVMALRLDVVCTDAILYIDLAEALDRGDLQAGFSGMHLNTLPVVLMLLHRLGFGWEQGGEAWSVLMSTAVVLPLFGWARRQFDDRIAAIACILYAVHPGLIERSPEIIRDPTFWLAFMLSLYCLWRAVTEVRLVFFLAAGFSIVLAALTRFEGLFLLIPLAGWLVARWLALRTARWRLCTGSLLTLFAFPLLLIMVNLFWVHSQQVWDLFRFDPLQRAQTWVESWTGLSDNEPTGPHDLRAADGGLKPRRLSPGRFVIVYVVTVLRGFDPIMALLIPASYIGWWPLWRRRDQLPLLFLALAILTGTWIHLWYAQEVSSRYVSPVFLLAAPCAALGLCWPAQRQLRLPAALTARPWLPGALMVAILTSLGIFGWTDAFSSNYRSREAGAQLGKWIAAQYGPTPAIVGSRASCSLPAYYVGCGFHLVEQDASPEQLLTTVAQARADVVLVSTARRDQERALARAAPQLGLGLRRIDPQELPPGCTPSTVVYARDQQGRASVSPPSDATRRQ